DPNANDRYGFRKANQYISRGQYDEWNGQYSEYLARRRKKWEAFLKENGLITDKPTRFPPHSAKAKRFVRKGIPPEWRGAAWFYYAGGPKILAHNQGVYNDMLNRAKNGELNEVCRDDIERDLYRTFPDNVRFRRTAAMQGQNPASATPAHSRTNSTQSANPQPRPPGSEPEIIDQLRRVLSAFAIFNPNIGYCQSLNFLGGMLLLFVESEEHAFWLLNIITRVYLPGTHEMNLEGSKVDLSVLMAELQDVLPSVWTRISDDGSVVDKTRKKSRRHRNHHKTAPAASDLPPVTLALTAWFMSCFIGTLPIETTLRVWDVFFYEGSKTLFRVALAIFKAGENEIKAINDPMEVFAVVQSLPRKMVDANGLMDICFRRRNGLNHLTSELIDEQRADRKEKLHTER
ncbi:rab-GTPase-TBC domain-containing protein, partial [Coniella lustricola]